MAKPKRRKPRTTYGLGEEAARKPIPAPTLAWFPPPTKRYHPNIALIGCGGISEQHLTAYRNARYNVVALCSRTESKAEKRRETFFPRAKVYTDYRHILDRPDIDIVDITPHPADRIPIIRAALDAGKHVLSQKPFVTDLATGRALVKLAEKRNRKLAINQNGRWAPHFAWMREAIRKNLIGDLTAAHLAVHWNHNWIAKTPFNSVRHILLFDFAVHWFDILTCFMGDRPPTRVFASFTCSPSQKAAPPLLAQALVEYEGAQATLAFDADTPFGPLDETYLAGAKGSLHSTGPSLSDQQVTLYTRRGVAQPKLNGAWFPDGFHGAMAELLLAIEQNREPSHSAANNLRTLELTFAAVKSADTGQPQRPGAVKQIQT